MKKTFFSLQLLGLLGLAGASAGRAQGVGIGVAAPDATLDVARGLGFNGTAAFRGTVATSHFNYATAEDTYLRGGKAGSVVFINDYAGAGGVGIGPTFTNTRLSISSNALEAKLTLWDGGNAGAHYGFGITSGQLNYHVDSNVGNHVFWAGGKNADGTELARLTGTGRLGLGLAVPLAVLDVARGTAGFGTAAFRGTDRISHFNYDAAEDTYIRGGKMGSNVYLNDSGGGRVGVGTATPAATLDVNGTMKIGASGTPIGAVLLIVTSFSATIANNSFLVVVVGYPGITANGTAAVSPNEDLPAGVTISWARSETNQVRFLLLNQSGASFTSSAGLSFRATVVQN